MRLLLVLLLLIFLIIGGGFLYSKAPFHFYGLAVKEGVDGDILKLSGKNKVYLKGRKNTLKKQKNKDYENLIWKDFHFSYVELPLPIEHPIVSILPIIEVKGKETITGSKFINRKGKELIKFYTAPSEKFKKYDIYQKLFRLPFFKNKMRKINPNIIWKDLFERKIKLEYKYDYSVKTFFSMIYDLYILNLRKKTFPKETISFSFLESKKIGIIKVKTDEEDIVKEIIFLKKEGVIYRLILESHNFQDTAIAIRERLLNNIKYKESSESSAKELYVRFKLLPYEKRIETSGIVYLFAGFTHVLQKETYLKQMINFLERGKNTIFFLTPLYHYAYRKFGSNFSSKDEFRQESAQKRLERKIEEELKKELTNAENKELIQVDGEFTSSKEKKNFYLKKAKDEKYQDDDDMLIEN